MYRKNTGFSKYVTQTRVTLQPSHAIGYKPLIGGVIKQNERKEHPIPAVMGFNSDPQSFKRFCELIFYGLLTQAKPACNLRNGEVVFPAHSEYLLHPGRQAVDLAFDKGAQFLCFQ